VRYAFCTTGIEKRDKPILSMYRTTIMMTRQTGGGYQGKEHMTRAIKCILAFQTSCSQEYNSQSMHKKGNRRSVDKKWKMYVT